MKRKLMLLVVLLVIGVGLVTAQVQKITGVVVSAEDGQSVIGASVLVKGTQIGTVTDMNGNFTLNGVPDGAKTLVISYVGMYTQEVAVKSHIVVKLASVDELLDEVVVVAYGTAKKQSLVGAQSSITGRSLSKRVLSNSSNALAGMAPGVQVTTSTGQPGSGAAIRIRGFGSVNASSAPVYVVDGAIYTGNISEIAPQDIQSMSVLKDAASTSLYGSSAGNGVILITTKSGSAANVGKPAFTFTMNQGFTRRGQSDYEKIGAMDYYPMRWQQWYNQYKYAYKQSDDQAAAWANYEVLNDLGYMPYAGIKSVYEYANKKWGAPGAPTGTAEEVVPAIVMPNGQLNPEVTGLLWADDLDWEKQLFRTGYRQEYIFGGGLNTDKMKSYISLSYLSEDGYRIQTSFERFSARANISYDVTKWLSVGTNTSFTRVHNEAPKTASGSYSSNPFDFIRGLGPIYPIHEHNADGSYILDASGNKKYDHSGRRPYQGRYNPVEEAYLDKSLLDRDALTNRTFAKLNLAEGLTFTTNISYDLLNTYSKLRYNNVMGDQPAGLLELESYRYTTVTLNQLLNYSKAFGKHELEFLLGHEGHTFKRQNMMASKKNMGLLGFDELANLTEMLDMGSNTVDYKKEGFFGRMNYNFDNRYNASVSYRLDGSSRFHPDNRWGSFWSVGFGWHISKEKFMEDASWINELKLRTSIGQTGVDALSDYYPYQTLYNMGNNNYYSMGYRMRKPGNPNLKWETQTSSDIALEFTLWNRLTGSLEFFNKDSKNLLFARPLPISSGIESMNENIAKVRNYGIEFSLEGSPIKTPDWEWGLKLNGTWLRNKLVRLPEANRKDGIELTYHKYEEGKSIFDYYLKEFIKVDPENGKAIYRLDKDLYPGEQGIGTEGEEATYTYNGGRAKKHFAGSSIPTLYGGFGTNLVWKGLELNLDFAYQLGGKTYDGGYASLMGRRLKAGAAMHVDMFRAWKSPGQVTDVPRLDAGSDGDYDSTGSDRFLISSSALMLRSASLSYVLPKVWVAPLKLNGIRVGVMGENLFLLSKRQGLNPMGQFNGVIGSSYYGYAKAVTFSLSISL